MPRLLLTWLGKSVAVCCASITALIPGNRTQFGRRKAGCSPAASWSCSSWNTCSNIWMKIKHVLLGSQVSDTQKNTNTSTLIKSDFCFSAKALSCPVTLGGILVLSGAGEKCCEDKGRKKMNQKGCSAFALLAFEMLEMPRRQWGLWAVVNKLISSADRWTWVSAGRCRSSHWYATRIFGFSGETRCCITTARQPLCSGLL